MCRFLKENAVVALIHQILIRVQHQKQKMLFQMRLASDCTMDYSFEVSALDGSFHEEQAVGYVYKYNECPYKSSFKQNLNRHKHVKHAFSSQADCFLL